MATSRDWKDLFEAELERLVGHSRSVPTSARIRDFRVSFIRPEVLLDHLSSVVGQTDLKRKLASVFSQYTLYLQDELAERPTALIYGPSGAGKTYAVETLASSLELPVTVVGAPGISLASHKGATSATSWCSTT